MAKYILSGWVIAAVLTVVAAPLAHSLPPPCEFGPDAGVQGEKLAVNIFLFCGLGPADPEVLPSIFFDDRRIKVRVTGGHGGHYTGIIRILKKVPPGTYYPYIAVNRDVIATPADTKNVHMAFTVLGRDPFCGNGTLDVGEDCDPPLSFCRGGCNPQLGICVDMSCSEQCSCPEPFCGDLVVDLGQGEECDDGNHVDGDGCSADCLLEGALCAGPTGTYCQSGEFCQFAANTCGFPNLSGVCTQIPSTCFLDCEPVIDPVCGCDGKTYSNDCMRRCGGTSLAHRGMCVAGEDCGWTVCPPDQTCCNPIQGICTLPGEACIQ
jgi:cysteine-rich repeat protein